MSRQLCIKIVAGLGALAIGQGAALAQQVEPKDAPTPAPLVKPVTDYDYEGDQIQGSFYKPGATVIEGETARKGGSLLTPRLTFVPEMLKSVEDL